MVKYFLGYGHIVPTTTNGKLQFIAYITVGLPVMMVFLAKIGNSMAFALKYLYSRIGCRWCRIRRKKEELLAKGELQENSVHLEDNTSQDINQAGLQRLYFYIRSEIKY